jgi:uncharacterized iron-regulated membrane protein
MATTLEPEAVPDTAINEATNQPAEHTRAAHFYRAVWRWHFYAGLFVIPFMLLLATTGMIYLFKPQLDALMYPQHVVPGGVALLPSQQLAAAQAAYPGGSVSTFKPAAAPDRSAEVVLTTADGRDVTAFINPYSGQVLGERDEYWNLQNIAMTLHGELMIGTYGDYLVELAACWALVLMVSGLYLWWPRKGFSLWGTLLPRLWTRNKRIFWRDLHSVPGFWGALIIIFMILTGLPWAGFWGTNFAQIWSRYPAQLWDDVPQSTQLTGSLNTTSNKTVPWAVEQLPLPQSTPGGGHGAQSEAAQGIRVTDEGVAVGTPVNLDSIVALAEHKGLVPGFGVSLPADEYGVYTVSVFPNDARDQATLHIDQYSGNVLADIRFADYGLVPQMVETGIALHEGKMFGLPNQLLMLGACLIVILLTVSGAVMWWQRRPEGRLGAPPMPQNVPLWKGAVAIICVLGVLFPLVGISLVVVLLLDWLVIARIPVLKRALS